VVQGVKKEIEASVGVSIPWLPAGFNTGFKYKIDKPWQPK
jgi:hypothetical protein